MTELGRKRGDERGEGEWRTNGNDRESKGRGRKERECPYLLINRPFRKGKTLKIPRGRKKTGGKQGGVAVEGSKEVQKRRVLPTPSANRVASPVGGSWGSTNSLELQGKTQKESKDHVALTF